MRVHERAPVIAGPSGTGLIGEAFRDAWRNFLHAIAGGIALSGVVVLPKLSRQPGWFVTRRVRARRVVQITRP